MEIIETILKQVVEKELRFNYIYRLVKSDFNVYIKGQLTEIEVYGIEAERQDIVKGLITNIERDCVKTISPKKEKVFDLFKILSDNVVSPIHLIDVIGNYIDVCAEEFDNDFQEMV